MLLGKINKKALLRDSYEWFIQKKENYTPQPAIITQLSELLNGYAITAFMGTWRGDSKREVPRFYKVLEEANFPLERLTLIAVDRKKESL